MIPECLRITRDIARILRYQMQVFGNLLHGHRSTLGWRQHASCCTAVQERLKLYVEMIKIFINLLVKLMLSLYTMKYNSIKQLIKITIVIKHSTYTY